MVAGLCRAPGSIFGKVVDVYIEIQGEKISEEGFQVTEGTEGSNTGLEIIEKAK